MQQKTAADGHRQTQIESNHLKLPRNQAHDLVQHFPKHLLIRVYLCSPWLN